MVLRKKDVENAKVVGELYGVTYYEVGDAIGSRVDKRPLPVSGTIIGYSWQNKSYLVKLDRSVNGSDIWAVSAHVL